jgi:L,D-transpeptidase ErfK/SrfK
MDSTAPAGGGVALDRAAPPLPRLETREFEIDRDQSLVGELEVLFTRDENTLPALAREYNVGYEELRLANPDVDVWLPGEGTPVYLPTQHVLPDAPHDGIVLNVAAMRLFYFVTDDPDARTLRVTTYPIGIGREGWETPTGTAVVTEKARDPVWYPPASVRREHAQLGDPLPRVVPAGPDNPLGRFALALSLPGYLIHGTNMPSGVGMRVSHGCVRLYPEDIERLFARVPTGTPVHIVNQPVLGAWYRGQLYLEVHEPLAEDPRDLAQMAEQTVDSLLREAGVDRERLDRAALAKVLAEKSGMPLPILRDDRSLDQYLAAVRVVENTLPLPATESASLAE